MTKDKIYALMDIYDELFGWFGSKDKENQQQLINIIESNSDWRFVTDKSTKKEWLRTQGKYPLKFWDSLEDRNWWRKIGYRLYKLGYSYETTGKKEKNK